MNFEKLEEPTHPLLKKFGFIVLEHVTVLHIKMKKLMVVKFVNISLRKYTVAISMVLQVTHSE